MSASTASGLSCKDYAAKAKVKLPPAAVIAAPLDDGAAGARSIEPRPRALGLTRVSKAGGDAACS